MTFDGATSFSTRELNNSTISTVPMTSIVMHGSSVSILVQEYNIITHFETNHLS